MSKYNDFLKEIFSPESMMKSFGVKTEAELQQRLNRTFTCKMPNGDIVLPEEALARRAEWSGEQE